MHARPDVTLKANSLQTQIHDYENEADQLEKMEAELLTKLAETQKLERDAFVSLESAMVESSIPKKARVITAYSGSTTARHTLTSRE